MTNVQTAAPTTPEFVVIDVETACSRASDICRHRTFREEDR